MNLLTPSKKNLFPPSSTTLAYVGIAAHSHRPTRSSCSNTTFTSATIIITHAVKYSSFVHDSWSKVTPLEIQFDLILRSSLCENVEARKEQDRRSRAALTSGGVGLRMYHERVVDHYNNSRNVRAFHKNDPIVGTGLFEALACGDVMKLQIKVDEESGKIADVCFKTFGCGSAIASSSVATEWVKGRQSVQVQMKPLWKKQLLVPQNVLL